MIAQQTRSGAMQGIMYGVLVSAKPVTKVTDRITKKMEHIFFSDFSLLNFRPVTIFCFVNIYSSLKLKI